MAAKARQRAGALGGGAQERPATATTLSASEIHAAGAKAVRQLLTRWNAVDQERRDADDALVDANALVAWIDTQMLDPLVQELGSLLLHEAKQDRKQPTFRKYFPEPPNDVIRLGLESEIERTRNFFHVAEEIPPSKEAKSILAKIKAVHEKGASALKARVEATTGVARIALKTMTWKEDANGARRSIETMLDAHANEHGLARDYSSAFFPERARERDEEAGRAATGVASLRRHSPPSPTLPPAERPISGERGGAADLIPSPPCVRLRDRLRPS